MRMIIRGRHLEVTGAIRDYAEKRFGKLETYFNHIDETEVVLKYENKKVYGVEVIVSTEGNKYIAKTKGGELYAEIDRAKKKIKGVLTKEKKKIIDSKREEKIEIE
ncbi:ribosome-associated translation inhibitor RaiA [Psychrilyobacter sp.]|uniref:ribosome hibernation-promoting factor, HPF/YfiA family n=1 Tax=Psychrilyobacter sp. TaxID=2586924 RepID=UPI00301A1AF2